MDAIFQKIHKDAKIPTKTHSTDIGWDVYAIEDYTIVGNGGRVKIRLGLIWEPNLSQEEKNYIWEIQVRPKSGIAINEGLTVLNAPGSIDQDYRDELCVIIVNTSKNDKEIKKGQKIAQFVIDRKPIINLKEGLIDLKRSPNRNGGFGSTGLY